MALLINVETPAGETRELYVRLNSIEASNHGVGSHALFRGYISGAAFAEGRAFVWEHEVSFTADVAQPIWSQAYAALEAEMGPGVAA